MILGPDTTDWHCHLLPGIDDGATSPEESIKMARILSAAGYKTVCCTPHAIRGVYDNRSDKVLGSVARLQQLLTDEGVDLLLCAGMEYYLDEFLLDSINDLLLLPGNLLLVEIPNHVPAEFVKETCYRIRSSGYTPLIAHPERSTLLEAKSNDSVKKGLWSSLFNSRANTLNSELGFQSSTHKTQNTTLLSYLHEIGCKFQGNLGSFAGIYGNLVKNRAKRFLQGGLYDCFGSDAHKPELLEEILGLGMRTVNSIKTGVTGG